MGIKERGSREADDNRYNTYTAKQGDTNSIKHFTNHTFPHTHTNLFQGHF
ncbi:hypothetical protein ccbrp13_23170 [Ktedonobacteria bacterium brp13]|nr:hypothetical protein ccbrp13_23170 [Ktedonobacteria bacterium brp13]